MVYLIIDAVFVDVEVEVENKYRILRKKESFVMKTFREVFNVFLLFSDYQTILIQAKSSTRFTNRSFFRIV